MRGRRARIDHIVTGLADFLVDNRHYAVMASTDPAAKRYDVDQEAAVLRQRVLTLFYGENPTGAERLAFQAVLWLPESLPDLVDLTDEELHKALRTTMLRILRVPN